MKHLILASASPRRARILERLGLRFKVVPTMAPECSRPGEPERTVRENALAKGAAVPEPELCAAAGVLSADTIVWFDGRIYGKPRDLAEARGFLERLSGNVHRVYTGMAFNGRARVETAEVRFRRLDRTFIDRYLELAHPLDRAGAYDIDEHGELIVESYSGEYETIMGLSIAPLAEWGLCPGRSVE